MTDERSLHDRLKSEERFYREAADTKGPYVHHNPERCKETADLLKEAAEELGREPTTFERVHPGYYKALTAADRWQVDG